MPTLDLNAPPENLESETPTTQAVVGIIYPPPEVRNIVDKTASFVARNGPEFEARIRQNELGNPKFNFLNFGDPYYGYYQHKVKDFREGRGQEPTVGAPVPQLKAALTSTQQKQQELLKQATEQPFIPKDPPTEFEFIADPPSISALDLDIVKLTAQFVARNGRQFLTNLMNREQRNYQFDFLRPQHSLFQYFTKLLEQYTKILIPPKDLMYRLKDETYSMASTLEQVKYRADWLKYEEAQRRKEEEMLEKERVAYAQIDWHDFVVVETVDYQPMEMGNFPPPTTPDEVGARVLLQERMEDGEEIEMQIESEEEEVEEEEEGLAEMEDRVNEPDERNKEAKDNTQVQDMEEESSSEDEDDRAPGTASAPLPKKPPPPPPSPSAQPQPPPLPPMPDKVVVKKGYDPKQARVVSRPPPSDEYLISPITGEKIPASKVQEHMRIGLLDPRWVEQRDRQIRDKINQETVYAPGSAIEASLKQLAERRTDIFGVGDEETAIGKKIGEEDIRQDDKVTWDGHTSSVEAATRAARAHITLEEQIHQIHKVKGLLPDEEKEKIGPKPSRSGNAPPVPVNTPKNPPPPSGNIPKPPSKPAPKIPPAPIQLPQPPMMPPPGLMPQQPGLMAPPPGMMMMQMGRPPLMPMGRGPPFPVPAPPPPMGGFMPPPQAQQMPQPPGVMKHGIDPSEEEPQTKKVRTEESLIPESQFLTRHKGMVTLKVAIPSMPDKSEWRLKGQTLTMSMPLTEVITAIKSRIHEETGMPPGRQKLHQEGLFLKDSNSLAYYNITPGTMLHLQIKERGGRKK